MIEHIYNPLFKNFKTKALRILPKTERPIFKMHYEKWEESLDWDAKRKVGEDFKKMDLEQFPMTVFFMLNGFKQKMREDTLKLAAEADKEIEDAEMGRSANGSISNG